MTPVLPKDMAWMKSIFPNLSPLTLDGLDCKADIKFKVIYSHEFWKFNNSEQLFKHYDNSRHFSVHLFPNDMRLVLKLY